MPRSHDGPLPWVSDKTIGEVLKATIAAHSDRDAVVFPALGVRWSWSELGRRVEHIARALIELGVEAGEHVGIWSMNVPEWVVTQFAAARVGAVLVNVNPAYRTHELEDALARPMSARSSSAAHSRDRTSWAWFMPSARKRLVRPRLTGAARDCPRLRR